MLVLESGPWHIFTKLRSSRGIGHDGDEAVSWPDGEVLACVWCTSTWVAIMIMVLPIIVILPFSLSCLAIAINGSIRD